MDILLISLAILLLILGLLGCFLPVLPGPPLSFLGLVIANFTHWGGVGEGLLITLGLSALLVTLIDYFLPIWATRKYGGSKRGVWGATIGMLLGILFFPPLGIIIGPFVGAYLGELTSVEHRGNALKSAVGSLLGFVLGIGLKLATSGVITYYFVKKVLL